MDGTPNNGSAEREIPAEQDFCKIVRIFNGKTPVLVRLDSHDDGTDEQPLAVKITVEVNDIFAEKKLGPLTVDAAERVLREVGEDECRAFYNQVAGLVADWTA